MTPLRSTARPAALRQGLVPGGLVLAGLLAGASWAAPALQSPPASPAPPPAATPAPAAPGASTSPPATAGDAAAPAAEDPGRTAGGALAFFMTSRDYHTIRELKSVMTPALVATYDHDSTPFNGKKGYRLSAFDYREPAPKPGSTSWTASVQSLWDDQGEAVELRTENIRLTREREAPWRVAGLAKTASEPQRYLKSIDGVTSLRMILRDWIRRDADGARGLMTDACATRLDGSKDGLVTTFAGDPNVRRDAYRILEMVPDGTTRVTAKVRLIETPPGRPASLAGVARELVLVKKGQRWLLDDWK